MISRQEGSAASYYIYDGGLSVRALTNEAGTVTDTLVFDVFGNETAKTGSTDNSYGFQGEEKDDTGLYYLRARYMDPSTGTFTSMDTYGGSLTDPMSLHKYLFANSNPVAYCDPSGHYTLTEQETTIAIRAIIGEASSGIYYIADMLITDPQMENHSVGGLIITMLMGLLLGACGGFAKVSASAWAFKMILGSFCITFGVLGLLKGYDDFMSEHRVYGIFEMVLSVIMISSGVSGFRAGWSEKGEYSGLGFTPNKRGYIRIGGWSEPDYNDYYKPGRPEGGNPREDQLIRKDKLDVKSGDFKDFLYDQGENPSKWKKICETWMTADGDYYERHYWTNGTESYYHD